MSSMEVRGVVAAVTVQAWRMASNLNKMTEGREVALVQRFEEIREKLARRVDVGPALGEVGLCLPLREIGASLTEAVGRKSAFLGEAKRLLFDLVPEGFATTVEAYRRFMQEGGLEAKIRERLEGLAANDVAACFEASAEVVRWIEATPVPAEIVNALQEATEKLGARRVAVRSSALLEDGPGMSFAGQYRSFLNVLPENVPEAFKSVIASKYTPEAITYRILRGIADMPMCCLVLPMIGAKAAGVAYSRVQWSEGQCVLVQAVRGLGIAAVDGSAAPWSFFVDRDGRIVSRKEGFQDHMVEAGEGEGTRRVQVDLAGSHVLDDLVVLKIARAARELDAHFGGPLDLEWAVTQDDRLFILQVRPQPGEEQEVGIAPVIDGATILLKGGARASGGVGFGPVKIVRTDLDMLRCPEGAVVVLHEANPRFAVLLQRAAAVVADMGEITGHLAAVAREMQVPALFALRTATRELADGQLVTVDADACVIYKGRVEEAISAAKQRQKTRRESEAERTLRSAAELIVPLNLTGRLSSGYRARDCKTLHDIVRYCHQKAIESLFEVGDAAKRSGAKVRRLRSPVPIDLMVLDLGGGLRGDISEDGDITLDDVLCKPMRELWKGMTDPRLQWTAPRSVSIRGFLASIVNYNFDQDLSVRRLGEPSYAFISADYLNLNSRIGYHFTTVDTRVTTQRERNYVSFRFVGGSTGIVQRSRRGMLIERILRAKGFEVDRQADLVNARLRHKEEQEMLEAIRCLGLLMGFVNHLDMDLVADAMVEEYEAAFLRGDYGYKGQRAGD